MPGSALIRDEIPLQRCLSKGPQSLSLRECLAALIADSRETDPTGMELALQVLQHPGSLPAPEDERAFFLNMEGPNLSHLQELSLVAQGRLQAAFELARRYHIIRTHSLTPSGAAPPLHRSPRMSSLQEQAMKAIPMELRTCPQEWFGFIPIYGSPATLGTFCLVERGVRTHVHIDPVELFARLLALRPCGFWITHNHPSGRLEPSPSDFELTAQVFEISRELGIPLLGHAIVCHERNFFMTGSSHAP